MSRIAMLNPGDSRKGVVDFVLDTIRSGGGKPCPPVIAGVGLGGNFEYAALLSKRALMRTVGSRNSQPYYAELETELLAGKRSTFAEKLNLIAMCRCFR